MNTRTTKVCTGCEEDRPLEAFPTDGRYSDGRKPVCQECAARGAMSDRAANLYRAIDRMGRDVAELCEVAQLVGAHGPFSLDLKVRAEILPQVELLATLLTDALVSWRGSAPQER